jgi:type VI protein secretion system component Hcp
MKTILVSFFALISLSASCMADNISVTVGTAAPCTFSASSIMGTFTNPNAIGSSTGGAGAGKATFSPLVVLKSLDSCSVPLDLQLFKGSVTPIVTIAISESSNNKGASSNATKPLVLITLRNVLISEISDTDSSQGSFSEKVTLLYGAITIQDLVDNTSTTCDSSTNTCS